MKRPALQDDAFLADVAAVRALSTLPTQATSLFVWWLGQSGFLVHWSGHSLLLDPYLSDSLTQKYAGTDKPHVRMTERVVAPGRLDFIDVVGASHHHTDHLDPETLKALVAANPRLTLICPEAHRALARERSGLPDPRILGLNAVAPASDPAAPPVPRVVRLPGFQVTAVPAAHESLDPDERGHLRCLGFVVQAGPFVFYHAGDTVRYEGMEECLRQFRVDLALLPINGSAPERRVPGNLSGGEAAQLASAIQAKLVVPCHYDLFAFNTVPPDAFASECQRLGQRFRVLELGERMTLQA